MRTPFTFAYSLLNVAPSTMILLFVVDGTVASDWPEIADKTKEMAEKTNLLILITLLEPDDPERYSAP